MKALFDELSHQVSKATTNKYSTSFSLGILALKPRIRNAIYAIYGYVRLADEIVDSFHGYNRTLLLSRFKEQTFQALEERISLNPILQSFQETIHKYQIPQTLIEQFLKSMEMDLEPQQHTSTSYKEYILGSAEVVGLMCLRVFVEGDDQAYHSLTPSAMKLGAAFQKVNFLRDMKDDYTVLGRCYFPEVDFGNFNNSAKLQIEKDIENDFKEALIGIKKLPVSSKFGVFLAYKYYLSLFSKIRKISAQKIIAQRIRIPNGKKLSLMMSSYIQYKITAL